MSRQERENWQRQLAANPALREAWDDFRAILAQSAERMKEGQPVQLADLRQATARVRDAVGDDQAQP